MYAGAHPEQVQVIKCDIGKRSGDENAKNPWGPIFQTSLYFVEDADGILEISFIHKLGLFLFNKIR